MPKRYGRIEVLLLSLSFFQDTIELVPLPLCEMQYAWHKLKLI